MRVTEVLDYATMGDLRSWIDNNSKAKRKGITDEALRVGTIVDEFVRQDIQDGGYLVDEGDRQVENCMKAWEAFKEQYPLFCGCVRDMQIELTEGELMGHPDFIVERHGGTWGVVDLKTSRMIRPNYWTQTAQYAKMYTEMKHKPAPNFIGVIRLDKETGTFEYVEMDADYILYEIDIFKSMLAVYNHNADYRELIRQKAEEAFL